MTARWLLWPALDATLLALLALLWWQPPVRWAQVPAAAAWSTDRSWI